jgi:hypothetical protein
VQIKPSKTKRFQIKRLGFPWIPLADSGLFNELRGIQIKKLFSLSARVSGCIVDTRPDGLASVAAASRHAARLPIWKIYSIKSSFTQIKKNPAVRTYELF